MREVSNPQSIVELAVTALGQHLRAQRVGYGEIQADDESIALETSYVDSCEPLHGIFKLDSFGPLNILQQRSGKMVAQNDIQLAADADAGQWGAIQTRAFASVPLIREGRLRATLFVNFRDPHQWAPAELLLVQDVGARIWDALERARAEEALRASEARLIVSEESLRLATEAAEVGTWDLDLITNVLTWPARTKAMFGISPEAPCCMDDFYNGLHPDDRAAIGIAFASSLDPEQRLTYDVEYRTIGKEDGVVRWVAARGKGLFDKDGRCVRALGTAVDITARKASEERIRSQDEALRQAQERLAAIFNFSAEGFTLCQLLRDDAGKVIDYQVLDVNPAHRLLTGASREQMLSKRVSQIAPPVDPRWFESAEQAIATGLTQTFEVRSRATGRWLDIHVSAVSGDLFAQTFIDVTARHDIEAQRVRLVAEMNHRVKNNFQMVISVLDLQARRSNNQDVQDQLATAQRRIYLLAELHDGLACDPSDGNVNFPAYLGAICDKLRALIADPNRIQLQVSVEPVSFDADIAVPLGFIASELVTNAIKYAFPPPSGGVVHVSFTYQEATYVLNVADNGQGFDKTIKTKPSSIGMRLVHSFVGQIGGKLQLDETAGVSYAIYLARTVFSPASR